MLEDSHIGGLVWCGVVNISKLTHKLIGLFFLMNVSSTRFVDRFGIKLTVKISGFYCIFLPRQKYEAITSNCEANT